MIIEIIKKSIPDSPAIAFSGGLDSSLLAFLSKNPTLYTLNIIDSQDLKWARYIAKKYNFELIEIKIDKNELIDVYKEYRKLYNPVKSQVYAPTELLIKYIDRKEIVFGSGSEEVFAGYDRYYKASNYLEMLRIW
jgi:asparagine synthase (glutamine-hydrolysing)